ncbi:RIC1-domain-containing protein [Obelidium mucronatum]|nr:RIC1-domain-containing protein [Obelidium mucronatum]
MYFVEGTAKRLSQRADAEAGDERIVAARLSPDATLFVCVAAAGVALWAVRPRALLSHARRAAVTVAEDGRNRDAVWRPDATALIVLTDRGFLHFYDVVRAPPLAYAFPAEHHFARGPGEGRAPARAALVFKMALEINTGIRCGVGLPDEVLLCTNESPSILSLSWTGIVNEFDTISLADLTFVDPDVAISFITVNSSMDLFAWINEFGDAFIAQRIEEERSDDFSYSNDGDDGAGDNNRDDEDDDDDAVFYSWAGLCFHDTSTAVPPATCISINPRFHIIALGDAMGHVKVYQLTDDRQEAIHSHDLISNLGQTTKLGAVSSIEWTPNGSALAVGWKTGGISIWSLFGTLLFQSNLSNIQDDLNPSQIDPYFYGVDTMFWGQGGTELLIHSSATGDRDLYALKFLQSPLANCQNMDNVSTVFLVGDDKLLIRDCSGDGLDAVSLDLTQWESVQIPVIYLASNWPIRYAVMNSTATFVAIAGTRGLAHYNIQANRWKLFGNESQEQSFAVRGGLLWYEDLIVAATQDFAVPGFQIRIFSRESNLDLKCLHTEPVAFPVVQLSIFGSTLLCLTDDCVLRRFDIVKTNAATATLRVRQQVLLENVIHHVGSVQSILWNPINDATALSANGTILLLNGGILSLLEETTDGVWKQTMVTDKVEYFWISHGVSGVKQTLWTFGLEGLKIWILHDDGGGGSLSSSSGGFLYAKENMIHENISFYPLCIMFQRGLIFGLESGISTNMAAQCVVYRPEANSQLFLDTFIRFFLLADCPSIAYNFISHYKKYKYFSHSLEMLLHKVLEDESAGTVKLGTESLLQRVVEFLKRFPRFLDIISQCARKTDVSLWEHFFNVAGEPEQLFQACLDRNYLRTATSYLIIIQTLKPASVSVKFAEALLQKALDTGDFRTAKELIRFYKSIDGYSDDMVGTLRLSMEHLEMGGSETVDPKKSSPIDPASNTFHLEVVINHHARKLLREYRIRALGQFSKLFSIPLASWVAQEWKKLGLSISDWSLAFASIHEQFGLLYPDFFGQTQEVGSSVRVKRRSLPLNFKPPPATSESAGSSLRLDMKLVNRRMEGPKSAHIVPSESLVETPVFQEIRDLGKIFAESGCTPWAVILFSLLFEVEELVQLLRKDSLLRQEWGDALTAASAGYAELVGKVVIRLDLEGVKHR